MWRSCEAVLFAGPTLYGLRGKPLDVPTEIEVRPPVRRGQIAALTAERPPGCIILADGLFHQGLSVGHAELRQAAGNGWRLWGLSSMGAIRAWEMRYHGMTGFGQVYAHFAQEDDFQDDEVALLHESQPPYAPASEPLVHLRTALTDWQRKGWLSEADCREIAAHLKSLWYGDRTLALFRRLLVEGVTPARQGPLLASLSAFDAYRIKTHDLAQFLRQRIWREEQK